MTQNPVEEGIKSFSCHLFFKSETWLLPMNYRGTPYWEAGYCWREFAVVWVLVLGGMDIRIDIKMYQWPVLLNTCTLAQQQYGPLPSPLSLGKSDGDLHSKKYFQCQFERHWHQRNRLPLLQYLKGRFVSRNGEKRIKITHIWVFVEVIIPCYVSITCVPHGIKKSKISSSWDGCSRTSGSVSRKQGKATFL